MTVPTLPPGASVAIGLVAMIIGVLLMNKGSRWFVNLKAQDEPILVGAGVAIILASSSDLFTAIGVLFVIMALVSRYTGEVDIDVI